MTKTALTTDELRDQRRVLAFEASNGTPGAAQRLANVERQLTEAAQAEERAELVRDEAERRAAAAKVQEQDAETQGAQRLHRELVAERAEAFKEIEGVTSKLSAVVAKTLEIDGRVWEVAIASGYQPTTSRTKSVIANYLSWQLVLAGLRGEFEMPLPQHRVPLIDPPEPGSFAAFASDK